MILVKVFLTLRLYRLYQQVTGLLRIEKSLAALCIFGAGNKFQSWNEDKDRYLKGLIDVLMVKKYPGSNLRKLLGLDLKVEV